MTVTPESFLDQTRFAVFADVDDDDVQAAIDRAERRTNRTAWGVQADDGVDLLVAHILTMDARAAAATTPATSGGATARGPLTSETVGPLSRSFASPGGSTSGTYDDAWLMMTGWGAQYLSMRQYVFADRVL